MRFKFELTFRAPCLNMRARSTPLTFWLHGDGGTRSAHGVERPAGVLPVGGAPHPRHGEHALVEVLCLLAHVGVVVQHSGLYVYTGVYIKRYTSMYMYR